MRIKQQLLLNPPTSAWISRNFMIPISSDSRTTKEWTVVNEQVNESRTPDVYSGEEQLQELDELSAFEQSMTDLFREGLINCDYMQDIFKQEQIFKDNFERIKNDFPNKDIVVCGGEIFEGDTLKEAETKAHNRYGNRATYSYTPNVEL